VSGSSSTVGENEEEASGVSTNEGGQCGARGRPAMADRNGGGLDLGGRAIRVRMERADARTGNVVWRWCSRAAFIGRGTTGGERSRSNLRRLSGASMAKPFRAGRKWGGETRSWGDERGSGADSFCHGRGKRCCTGEVSRQWQCSVGRRWRRLGRRKETTPGEPSWAERSDVSGRQGKILGKVKKR
jgi:hypothetical protein